MVIAKKLGQRSKRVLKFPVDWVRKVVLNFNYQTLMKRKNL